MESGSSSFTNEDQEFKLTDDDFPHGQAVFLMINA